MVFTNNGTNRMITLLSNDITTGVLGSGSTAAQLTDTALASSITGTNNAVTDTISDKQLVIDYSLTSTQAVGETIAEIGLLNDNGVLFSRTVFASTVHSSTDQWQLSTRLWVD